MRWMRRRRARSRRPAVALAGRTRGLLLERARESSAHDTGTRIAAIHRRVRSAATTVRGSDRRRRDGSSARALRHVCLARRLLPARGFCGGSDLRGDLRVPGFCRSVVRRRPRHGTATDEHHQGCRRRSRKWPRLPSRGRPRALPCDRERPARRPRDSRRPRAGPLPM